MRDQKLNRRAFLQFTAGAAATAILASCKQAPQVVRETVVVTQAPAKQTVVVQVTPTPAPAKPVTVRFISGAPEEYYLTKVYNETNTKKITVNLETIGDRNLEELILTGVASGDPPEVAWGNCANTFVMAQQGAFQEISSLMDKSPHPEMKWINPAAINFFNSPGYFPANKAKVPPGQWGWGVYMTEFIFFYNKDAYKAAGAKEPALAGITFDEFREQLKKLTDASKNKFGWYLRPTNSNQVYHFIFANGGRVYDDKGKSALAEPAAIEAMQFLQDMVVKDKTVLKPGAATQALDWFSGNMGWEFTGMWGIGWYDNACKFPYGVTLGPKAKKEVSITSCDGFGFCRRAKNLEAAWEFAKWLSSTECQNKINELDVVEVLSANTEALKKAYINAKFTVTPEVRDWVTGIATSKAAHPIPYEPVGPGFRLGSAFERLWAGEAVAKVADDIAKNVDKLLG